MINVDSSPFWDQCEEIDLQLDEVMSLIEKTFPFLSEHPRTIIELRTSIILRLVWADRIVKMLDEKEPIIALDFHPQMGMVSEDIKPLVMLDFYEFNYLYPDAFGHHLTLLNTLSKWRFKRFETELAKTVEGYES